MVDWKPIQIVEKISTLPTLPTTVSAILREMANPDSSAIGLAKLISSDQSLAGSILRVVNSAYYNFPRKIGSLTDAIVLLGYKGIRGIVLSVTAFRFFSNSSDYLDRKKLWTHTLACAIITDFLSHKLKIEENSDFEAGLLHDIGKVVTEKEGSHVQLGVELLKKYGLPEKVINCVAEHHEDKPFSTVE